MENNDLLRKRIRQELQTVVSRKRREIQDLQNEKSIERTMALTVTGGLLAGAARNACEQRAERAQRALDEIKNGMKWQEEMLDKYQ